MKIKYLGTAAYEGIPSLFCQCKTCLKSLSLGGRNIRSRSQALINDDLLLDFPPDTVFHYHQHKFDFSKIHYCLITHSHSDHFYPEDIEMIRTDYSHISDKYKMHYYLGQSAYDVLSNMYQKKSLKNTGTINLLKHGEWVTFGNYKVLPLNANHSLSTSPFIYVIKYLDKTMLYAHDTGMINEEGLELLKFVGHLDLISLDCTGGIKKGWVNGHMCVETNLLLIKKLEEMGVINKSTIKVLNHFSHNGNATYDELVDFTKDKDVIISYDGLEIEF